jgi:Putative adhesin
MTGDATAEQGIGALEIATLSGSVVIRARPVARPEVLSGRAEIQPDGVVRAGATGRIEIACPEGSDVVIGSSSGRVECHGRLGRVAVTGRSGRISIDEAREVDVRSASGRVVIGRCEGLCRVAVVSGAVMIGSAGSIEATVTSGRLEVDAVGDAQVHSVSGRVVLGLVRTGSVDVSTMSGRVSVSLPAGVQPDLQLASRSGRVQSDVLPGSDGRVTIKSFSGSIRVSRA